jgi:hypothetical protein
LCETKEYTDKCKLQVLESAEVRLQPNETIQMEEVFNIAVISKVEARKFGNSKFVPFSNDKKKQQSTHDILKE